MKWYKNGQLLSGETTKTVKTEKIDENNYVLKIEKCASDDSGTYSVEVQNEAGQAKSSGEVIIYLSFIIPVSSSLSLSFSYHFYLSSFTSIQKQFSTGIITFVSFVYHSTNLCRKFDWLF